MKISGDVKVHKSDGVTRAVIAAKVLDDGSLAVWDSDKDKEPDIIVTPDKWERVERDGHNWRQTSTKAIMEQARERDDVDEDKVAEVI